MRKPRDFDAELQALDDKARVLRARKLQQLGELVVATGADTLSIEVLAGTLLSAAEAKDAKVLEVWRTRGATFFRRSRRNAAGASSHGATAAADAGGTLPFAKPPGA